MASVRFAHIDVLAQTHHTRPQPWELVPARMTFCYTVDDESNRITYGVATCATRDHFCRRTGRLISEGRFGKLPRTY